MYVASQPIIQVRSLHDMKVVYKLKTDNGIDEITSTESHLYYIDKDPFGRSCCVYQTQFYTPDTESSRVLISTMIVKRLFAHAGCIYATYHEHVFKLINGKFVLFVSLSLGNDIVYFDVRTNSSSKTEYLITTSYSVFMYNGISLDRVACMGKINSTYGNRFRRGMFLNNKYGFLTNKGLMIVDANETTFIPNCVSVVQFQDFIVCFMTTEINTSYPCLSSIRFYCENEYIEVIYKDNKFNHTSVFKTPDETAFGFVSGRHIRLVPFPN